jgi:hypothetical protein
MEKVPQIGSTVSLNCQYYTGKVSFSGIVIKPHRWISANEFCLQTNNKEFPVSVINTASIVDMKIIKGSAITIKKFTIKGSKNDEYTVTKSGDHYSCHCIGFKYHSKCKHITEAKTLS